MRIYLIGFMATGKSTLGQQIAHAEGVPFIDTDTIIESQAGMTIPELFETHGELYFRQLEADVLRQTTFYPKSINATGGGLPVFEDNMSWMNRHGITVYLQWKDDLLIRHLSRQRAGRPLLAHLTDMDADDAIRRLLTARKPVYEQAAITIEMKGDVEADFLTLQKACRYIW